MGGWGLNAYDERSKARLNKRLQVEAACGAVQKLIDEGEATMPPDGIHASRWAAMVNSLKIAIEDGNEKQVDDSL